MGSERSVRIVTDGSVAVREQSISILDVTIVPCKVVAGRQTFISSAETSLFELGRRLKRTDTATIQAPEYGDFIRVYQQLGKSAIVSIHGAPGLGEFGRQARLARNLLPPQHKVSLFEAPTVGAGLSFLVEISAQAADRGVSFRAMRLMLERIRDEALRTVILAEGASVLMRRAEITDARSRWQAMIPGTDALFAVEASTARLRLVAQGRNLASAALRRNDLFKDLAHPCDAMIVHSGYERAAQDWADQLPGMLGGKQARVQPGGLDMTPYARGNYLAIIVYPTLQVVEQIERFAVRWDRALAKK